MKPSPFLPSRRLCGDSRGSHPPPPSGPTGPPLLLPPVSGGGGPRWSLKKVACRGSRSLSLSRFLFFPPVPTRPPHARPRPAAPLGRRRGPHLRRICHPRSAPPQVVRSRPDPRGAGSVRWPNGRSARVCACGSCPDLRAPVPGVTVVTRARARPLPALRPRRCCGRHHRRRCCAGNPRPDPGPPTPDLASGTVGAVAQLRQLAIVGADPSPPWPNLMRSAADPVRVAVLVEQQGADETEAPSGTLWSGSGVGAAVWRPCGRRGHASFLRISESTSARRRRGPLGDSRSSLLAGLEAPWHSGAPSPDPRCRLTCLGVYPARLLAPSQRRWRSLRHFPS